MSSAKRELGYPPEIRTLAGGDTGRCPGKDEGGNEKWAVLATKEENTSSLKKKWRQTREPVTGERGKGGNVAMDDPSKFKGPKKENSMGNKKHVGEKKVDEHKMLTGGKVRPG